MSASRKSWLVLPVLVLCAADVGLTLASQSSDYWAGRYELAHEANPFARPALVHGPATFVGFGFGCSVAVAALVWWWRHPVAVCVAVVTAVAHAVGCAGWLSRSEPWGWAAAVVFLIATAEGTTRCWRRAVKADEPVAAPNPVN